MNVLVIGDRLFSVDVAWGFNELGHSAQYLAPGKTDEFNRCLAAIHPDLIVTVGSPSYYSQAILECLSSRPVPFRCVHWDTDGITWANIELNLINKLKPDLIFTVCPEMLVQIRSLGWPCESLFYAYSPETHHPGPVFPEHQYDFSFVGTAYLSVIKSCPDHYRRKSMDALFKPLLDTGRRIDFYGHWDHITAIKTIYNFDLPREWVHGHFPFTETWKVYNSSFINLVTQNHEHTLTKRTFEILASGGFALSYDTAAVREYFHPGKGLTVSSSPGETLEIVEYYQNHPAEYATIRQNAQTSVQQHTYKQRAEQIINELNRLQLI